MEKLPISACLVIYNEEDVIDRCLKSIADLVDEVIIVHDGLCRDQSLNICRKYTNNVFERDHKGEAELHRPWQFQRTTHDWILQLDADEYVSDELRAHLGDLIRDRGIHGYELLWPTLYRKEYVKAYHKLVLVRKNFFYLVGVPHEHFTPIDSSVIVKRLSYGLEHRPKYDNLTFYSFRTKWMRWIRIQAQYYAKDFSEIETFNYPFQDWDRRTRLRIKHPIIFGIIGSVVYHLCSGLVFFVKNRKWILLKSGALMAMYHATLWWYVWRCQRAKQCRA